MQHKPTFAVPKNKVLPKDGAWERKVMLSDECLMLHNLNIKHLKLNIIIYSLSPIKS